MEIIKGTIKNNQAGFTIIELLISMTIISIVVTGIVTSRMSQQNQSITQQQAVDVQQTVRAGLYMMIQELRMAGYSTQNDGFDVGIINIGDWTKGNKFTIAYTGEGKNDGIDNDGDSSIDEADEANTVYLKTVSYWLDGTDLWVNDGGNDKLMAENIASVNTTCLDRDNTITANAEDVRSITIELTAQTPSDQIDRTRGQNNTRTLETTVTCRNLGL